MSLKEHVVLGGVASAGAWYLWGPWNALLFWAAAVLIDVDHYFAYLFKTGFRDWRVDSIFKLDRVIQDRLQKRQIQGSYVFFNLFHTIEFFLLFYGVAVWTGYHFLFVVLYGMLFHMACDLLYSAYHKCLFLRAFSVPEYYWRRSQLSKAGKDPKRYYEEMLQEAFLR